MKRIQIDRECVLGPGKIGPVGSVHDVSDQLAAELKGMGKAHDYVEAAPAAADPGPAKDPAPDNDPPSADPPPAKGGKGARAATAADNPALVAGAGDKPAA